MKVGSVGCGNVGLNTLRAFAKRGHTVLGLDPDKRATDRLAQWCGADAVVGSMTELSGADAVFVCVPTEPIAETGAADLSIIEGVVDEFATLETDPRWCPPVVVQRSTCPPGTAARLSARLTRTQFAVNPSFLAKSQQWRDSDQPPRIAYAGPVRARTVLRWLYADFPGSPTFECESYAPVELLKYVENSIDAVLISLWNEYLGLADALRITPADFAALADAVADRDRFATTVRAPGGAFGLHCLPKDLRALIAAGVEAGARRSVLTAALTTNCQVACERGENQLPTSDLITITRGRVRLTAAARAALGQWRGRRTDEPDVDE